MTLFSEAFEANGYHVLKAVASDAEIRDIEAHVAELELDGAGTRNLLAETWCRRMADKLRRIPEIASVLPPGAVAVQCTYFEKSKSKNWLVAVHRDLSVPVKARIDSPEWTAWSEKEGVLFARPPKFVLQSVVAVRVHLEENGEANSPLLVVPGSHVAVEISNRRDICLVPSGGALLMRPLLLHASSKLVAGRRRVLHFVFGPRELPNNAEWAHAV
jgi:ectoine hydroxylase-related dioxygenase (phytanoyl-CoA dioxygenase family)